MLPSRRQAGVQLVQPLKDALRRDPELIGAPTVVIGMARGGVLVAQPVAEALQYPLELLVVKRISSPESQMLSLGAVAADGTVVLDEENSTFLRTPRQYIDGMRSRFIDETVATERQILQLAGIANRLSLKDKRVILVDDGVMSGMSAMAAVRCLQLKEVSAIIFATPVCSYQAYRRLRDECDQVISLTIPYDLNSVGQYYDQFPSVDEAEVSACLSAARRREKITSAL